MFVTVKLSVPTSRPLLAVPEAAIRPGNRIWAVRDGQLSIERVNVAQTIEDKVLLLDSRGTLATGSGEVISRATSDVENVRRLLGFAVLSLTNTALAYSLTLPAMLAIDPWLSLAAVGLSGGERRAPAPRLRLQHPLARPLPAPPTSSTTKSGALPRSHCRSAACECRWLEVAGISWHGW